MAKNLMSNDKKEKITPKSKGVSKKKDGLKRFEPKIFTDSRSYMEFFLYTIGIIGVILLVYWPTPSFDLNYCDDNWLIFENFSFHKDLGNIWNAFLKPMGVTYYRPMLTVSFIIDANLSGIEPWAYHLSNYIYHILGSLLIFYTLIRIGYNNLMSFLLGVMFAIHPILTPAVSWISGRNDSMITVFILISFLFFINFLNTRKIALQILYYVIHIFFLGISLFTKETSVVLPILCIVYIMFFRKDKLFTNKNWILAAGWIIMGLFFTFMRFKAVAGINSPDVIGISSLIKNFPTVIFMFGKIFLPVKMIAIPSYEPFTMVSGIISFTAVIIVTFLHRKKLEMNKIWFAWLWYILVLLPSFMIRILNQEHLFDYAEHRAYLPMIAILIMIAEFCKVYKIDFGNLKKPLPLIIAILILGALGIRSYVYQWKFENRMVFWSDAVEAFPNRSKAYQDLGEAYFAIDSLKKAEELYLRGIELNPKHKPFYINLAVLYHKQGLFEKSEEASKKALEIEPGDGIANYNLAQSYLARNNPAAALPYLEKAAMGNLNKAQVFSDLGATYFRLNKFKEAIGAFQQALAVEPNNVPALTNLGAAYYMTQQHEPALQAWLKANAIEPNAPDPYFNLIRHYTFILKDQASAMKYVNEVKRRGFQLPSDLIQVYP